ncbi:MAG: class I SAM-dependent methyltransferase [Caldilineaceae bacterium]|nr:class I SAM-dependent methyltransferase [Caldilineaceae bacterium]
MLEIRHRSVIEGTTQDAYDAFYQERELLMRDSFYMWLIELLEPTPGRDLLDISCGHGRLVQLAMRKGLHAIGLDFSIAGMERGIKKTPKARWVNGDGEQMPFADASMDYITHIGSLEHYLTPARGAAEIARLLKPEGKACILLPNAFGLFGNIRYVRRTGEIFDDRQPLQRYATRATWEMLLTQGGLQIDQLIPWGEVNRPRTVRDFLWTLCRPQKGVRALLAAMTPINLTNHFIFICRRAPIQPTFVHYPMLPPVP